ncbi:endonuclease/exonuclease/phosphatase family protein [Planctomycetota bacterium]|nr:endonuclease/exonuclease/phosphatase family protein [Planctomycetota bacterium]
MTSLRIMTYNIQTGHGHDHAINLNRAASLINDCKPDLVALQEIDCKAERSSFDDQAAILAQLTNMNHFFAPATNRYGGDYGNAILSRFPIQSPTYHQLNQVSDRESRNLAAITISPSPDTSIRLLATHLDHIPEDETDRITQTHHIINIIQQLEDTPTILAGDFNAIPGSTPLQILSPYFDNPSLTHDNNPPTLTWPAQAPIMRLDYILTSKPHPWTCTKLQIIPDAIASDHFPVIADLTLGNPD